MSTIIDTIVTMSPQLTDTKCMREISEGNSKQSGGGEEAGLRVLERERMCVFAWKAEMSTVINKGQDWCDTRTSWPGPSTRHGCEGSAC